MTNNNEKNGNRFVQRSTSRKSKFLVRTNLAIIALLAVLMVLSAVPPGIGLDSSDGVSAYSFTASPPTVDLGSAANFTILSKAGVTTTGTTYVVGDIGSSPVTSTAITGFDLTLDPSGAFATSALVDGKIYASDYVTEGTPAMLTTAIGHMQAAYDDAAGRSDSAITELNGGLIGGLDLVPGLYKWTSAVSIAENLTLSGNSTDVWIFSTTGALTLASGISVILNGTVNADCIFWQVAGTTTLVTYSTMHGIILGAQNIVLQTGANLNGRALSIEAVTLDSNYVTSIIDTTPPTVTSTVPMDDATDVAINSNLTATFSEPMDATTINNVTFTLMQGENVIDGNVTYVGLNATFTPTVNLSAETLYTANISTDAQDLSGNALVSNYTWNFTTGELPDTTPPTVVSVTPINGTTGVAYNSTLTAMFSEPMNASTITNVTFTLMDGATAIEGNVTYLDLNATFTPSVDLSPATLYNATISTAVEDVAGNALVVEYTWNFTTYAPDIIAPTVTSTVPVANATDVAYNSALTATFSEPMNESTITNVTFTLMQGETVIDGTVTYVGLNATFTPTVNLSASTEYTANISTGAQDLAGNALANNYTWNFTTGLIPDTTPPTVFAVSPLNGAIGVAYNSTLIATFSEPMDAATITNVTFTLMQGATAIDGDVTYDDLNATFTPKVNLSAELQYTATISIAVEDTAGNALVEEYVWSFTTAVLPDTTAPTVVSVTPANGTTEVAYDSVLTATFSEPMNVSTLTNVTFILMQGETVINGTVTCVDLNATFTPLVDLSPNTVYTATITTGAQDLAGNALASNYTWNFTTIVPETTPPTVVSVTPANGATEVAYNSTLTAMFSEAMNESTINNVTFTLKQGSTVINGTVTYVGLNATFTPTVDLSPNTVYTATISTGAQDLAGNGLASNYTWNFTTIVPDTTPPTVELVIPVDEATGVAFNGILTATFSEAMNESTINNMTFILMQGDTVINGTVAYIGMTATFTPTVNLSADTEYTAKITTGAQDLAGNALASNYTWSFTTGAIPDTTVPTVVSVTPVDEATGVAVNGVITIVFSEAMDPLTMTNVTITLTQGDTVIEGTVTYSGMTATFTPTSDLVAGEVYTVTVSTGAQDLAGNALASEYSWTFTTATESAGLPLWTIALMILVVMGIAIGVIFLRR